MSARTLALLWSLAVLALCSVPGRELPDFQFLPFSFDKWVHVGMFLGVGALWAQAVPGHPWRVFAWGVAFGIGIEVWQHLLPIGRTMDPLDAAADAVGMALGIGLARLVRGGRPRERPGDG